MADSSARSRGPLFFAGPEAVARGGALARQTACSGTEAVSGAEERDDGGIVGDDASADDLQTLRRTQIAFLTNAGGVRTKALKGAWAGFII